MTFEYDANGMRTKKFASIPYTYIYNGDKLTYMTDSSNQLHFNYDVNGLFSVIYNGATYYYVQNAQGDVCGKIEQPRLEPCGVYV